MISKYTPILGVPTLLPGLLSAIALVASCSSDAAPDENTDQAGNPDGGAAGSADAAPAQSLQLEPTYVMKLESTVHARDTETMEEKVLYTHAGAIVRVSQSGNDVQMTVQMCYATPPVIAGEQPRIPAAVVASVEPFTVVGTLETSEQGTHLTTERGAVVLGAQLANPLTDALPESDADPRVIDQDNDGHAGVTIIYPSTIGDIEIYAAAKFAFTVDADISSPAAFDGTSDAQLLTEIYGDNSFLVDVRGMAADAAATNEITSEEHLLFMTMAQASVTCAQVMDN